jgi:AraC family transcriptional regulator of arabinose operon
MRPDGFIPPYDYYLLAGHLRSEAGDGIWRGRGMRDWHLILTLSGCGRFGYHGGEILAPAGSCVLIGPGALHDYGTADGVDHWEHDWAHFFPRPYWLEWLQWPERAPGLMCLDLAGSSVFDHAAALFHSLLEYYVHEEPPAGKMFAMAMLEELLLTCAAHAAAPDQEAIDPGLRAALDHIHGRLDGPISIRDLAEAAGMSRPRLTAAFRSQFGQPPRAFIDDQRLALAKHQLDHTDLSVGAISENVGYASPFHFSRRFKKHTGLSPLQYRLR